MKQITENITNQESNNQWGGSRKGAGRKKKDHGKYYGFNSTHEEDAILSSIATSKTDFINEAIISYARTKGIV